MKNGGNTQEQGQRSVLVRDQLARWIEEGRLPGGTRLPSEPELADKLHVSRATLREALQSLASDGVIRRRRGSGTFVLERQRVANSFDLNFGVTQAIRASGMTPGTTDGAWRVEPATADNAERLGVAEGTSLLVIDRTRTADGQPVVVTRDILCYGLVGGGREIAERMLRGSVYQVLADLGVDVDYGVAHFRPIQADSVLAERLGVASGCLLVYLWQIDYGSSGAPVLFSHEYHLADAFDFSVVRRGPGRK